MLCSRDKPLRVLVLTTTPYPDDERIEREVRTLADAGCRLTVVCSAAAGQPSRETSGPIEVVRFRNPFFRTHEARILTSGDDSPRGSREEPRDVGALGYILGWGISTGVALLLSLRALWRPGFDIIHVHNPPDTLAIAAAVHKPFGKRIIYDHHDLTPEMYRARGGESRVLHRALLTLERLSCRLADHVIATNESYKSVDVERNGVASEKVTIVRNGPELDDVHAPSADLELRQRAASLIGYFGVMGPQDGVDYLLRALRHLVYELGRREVLCVLIGSGDAWTSVRQLADELGLNGYTHFVGWLPRPEAMRVVASLDIGVEPAPSNTYNDRSTMLKVMEYMVLGKPVVAFDLPENRFTAGEAGLFARPNDPEDLGRAIAELLDNPERRAEMGALGRRRIEEQFAWDHSARNLLSAYRRVSPH